MKKIIFLIVFLFFNFFCWAELNDVMKNYIIFLGNPELITKGITSGILYIIYGWSQKMNTYGYVVIVGFIDNNWEIIETKVIFNTT